MIEHAGSHPSGYPDQIGGSIERCSHGDGIYTDCCQSSEPPAPLGCPGGSDVKGGAGQKNSWSGPAADQESGSWGSAAERCPPITARISGPLLSKIHLGFNQFLDGAQVVL